MAKMRLTVARFIAAIAGTDGIKSKICAAVPCNYKTLGIWMAEHKSIQVAFDDECNKMIGKAHSVVAGNISAALKEQEASDTKQVDSGDAKWYLSRKGKDQGFGSDEGATTVTVGVTIADWRKEQSKRRKQVEDL